jgi:hypothetical protein
MTLKKTLIFFALILIMFLPGCNREEDLALEKVQFAFNAISSGISGGRVASGFPEGTTILLSLEKSSGESEFTKRAIPVRQFGESSITEPLELPPGTYRITDFMLADKNGTIQYATPKRGSPLANVVVHPLPYSFTISKNKVSTIDMEVVDTDQHTPEDFGYVSFSIDAVSPFSLSVFTYENGKASLTDADVYFIHGADTISRHQVEAKINMLPFTGDPSETYDLVVIKSGYARFTRSFVYNDLQGELGSKPLVVNLVPAFTLTKYMQFNSNFLLDFSGHGEIVIDWGDGSIGTFSIDDEEIRHRFVPGKYFMTVTGEIDKIIEFSMYYENGRTTEINFSHLENLQTVSMGFTQVPGTIDLSQNKKLTGVTLAVLAPIERIILPGTHAIKYIDVISDLLPPAAIDAVIDNIYKNAVSYNITEGAFLLDGAADGPLSAEDFDKLRQLRDVYHWEIDPNP